MSGIPAKNPRHPDPYPDFSEEIIALGTLNENRTCFDVHHYALDIEIIPEEKALAGWVSTSAVATRDMHRMQLDLAAELKIHSIRWGSREGQELDYDREHRAVTLSLPRTLKQGESFVVHVQYSGSPMVAKNPPWAGGMVWKKDDQGFDHVGVACESEGASIWFPCKDHPSDEPDSVDLHFTTADSSLMVVSNGRRQSTQEVDGKYRYSWKVTYPINVYNITFYLGRFGRVDDHYASDYGEMDIHHYVLESSVDRAREHFSQAKDHIRVYEELYGPYPWYEDGFKLVESPYAGMEHQSAIAYGSHFTNDIFSLADHIMLHEIGHEWFGNAITADDLADVWLQEGFTTYGEALYMERAFGAAYLDSMMRKFRRHRNQRPVVGPRDRRFFDYRDTDVYYKGAWILHSLRSTLDDDSLFFSLVRGFYREKAGITTNTREFIHWVNRQTGQDFNWFFDQFLFDRHIPIFEYFLNGKGELYFRWADTHPDFSGMPVRFWLGQRLIEVVPRPTIQRVDLGVRGWAHTLIELQDSFTLHGARKNRRLMKEFSAP